MCKSTIDITPWVAIVISLIALYVGYYTIRLQIISSIQEKLSNKAEECNAYIIQINQKFPLETHNVSAIVSSVINASHILDLQFYIYKSYLLKRKKQQFKDLFYLELHTSISEYIHRNEIELVPDDPTLRPIIKDQLQKCHDFLEQSDLKFRFK